MALRQVIINKQSGNILCERAHVRQDVLTDVLKTVRNNQTMVMDGDLIISGCLDISGDLQGGVVGTTIGGVRTADTLATFTGLLAAVVCPNSAAFYDDADSTHEKFIEYNTTTGKRSRDFFQSPPAAVGALQIDWTPGPGAKQVSRIMYFAGSNYIATYDLATGNTTLVEVQDVVGVNSMGFGTLVYDTTTAGWLAYMGNSALTGNYIMLQIDPTLGTVLASPSGFQSLGVFLGGMIKVGTQIIATSTDSLTFVSLTAAGEVNLSAPWAGNFTYEGDNMPWLQEMVDAGDLSFGNLTYDAVSGRVYVHIGQPIPMQYPGTSFQPANAIGWFLLSELQFMGGAPELGTPGPITEHLALGNGNDGEHLVFDPINQVLWHFSGRSNNLSFMEPIDRDTPAVGANTIVGTYPWGTGEVTGAVFDAANSRFIIAVFDDLWAVPLDGNESGVTYIGANPDANALRGLAIVGSSMYAGDPFGGAFYHVDPTDASTISPPIQATYDGNDIPAITGMCYEPNTDLIFLVFKNPLDEFGPRFLGTIDPTTAVVTFVLDTGDNFAGIEFDENGRLWMVTGDGANVPETLYYVDGLIGGGVTPETFDIRILPKAPTDNPHGIVYVP